MAAWANFRTSTLAASDQLAAARKTLADAQASLVAQKKQGSGQSLQVLKALRAGVVTAVSAAAGDHVAQDAALVALALGGGSSMERPLAIAIISGPIAQGPLVLLAMPAVYELLGGVRTAPERGR